MNLYLKLIWAVFLIPHWHLRHRESSSPTQLAIIIQQEQTSSPPLSFVSREKYLFTFLFDGWKRLRKYLIGPLNFLRSKQEEGRRPDEGNESDSPDLSPLTVLV